MKITFSILLILSISVRMAASQELSERKVTGGTKYSIENCLNRFDPEKSVKTSVGYQYWFVPQKFLEDGLTVKMSVVGPNQATHAPHQHADAEIFFILEGTAKVYLNGKTTTCPAYSTFYCPENSEHGISNASDKELKYLVIRKYPVE